MDKLISKSNIKMKRWDITKTVKLATSELFICMYMYFLNFLMETPTYLSKEIETSCNTKQLISLL